MHHPWRNGESSGIAVLLINLPSLLASSLYHALGMTHDLHVTACVEEVEEVQEGSDQPNVIVLGASKLDMLSPPVRIINLRWPHVPIVLVGETASDRHLWTIRWTNVRGFVTWDASASDLLDIIRIVVAGGMALCPSNVSALLQSFRTNTVCHEQPTLSKREQDVIEEITAERSNQEISQQLGISTKTVEYYVTRLLRLTATRSRTELAVYWMMNRKDYGALVANISHV